MDMQQEGQATEGVAIIGMAGRFPGAATIEAFWQNISAGREAVERIAPEEDRLLQRNPSLATNPQYIPAGAFLEDVDRFDAPFFGYTAREATLLDPQQRLFLECAWEALERSGYDAQAFEGRIGIYAGAGMNTYLLEHLYPHPELLESIGGFQMMLSNEKDFLATRAAYKLNLRGPAITVQTACSTSLVAVALAFQSLMNYQCDMALAGGVSLLSLEKGGYLYEQGGIASPDGHCRAFDADARGTVGGNGLGIVVLKRLEDALAAGDHITAIIRGVAINNDGGEKMGYTTPSLEGQVEVITEALGVANVEPESISYIEAHGTGTFIGDPIEVAALTRAFRQQTERLGFCALGSVKTNIGHLDVASGIAGLIKTCLALEHKMLPPSLHFAHPNPEINFPESPFYVNTRLQPWPAGPVPRRAGVSSFGIGGTNVHVVLEEAPARPSIPLDRRAQLLVLSAKTPSALEKVTERLAAFLHDHSDVSLADIACTLQMGRRAQNCRRIVAGTSHEEILRQLQGSASGNVITAVKTHQRPSLVFLYPGQGAQYVHMGRQLYEDEPVYRQWVDQCAVFLTPILGFDVRTLLFPATGQEQSATERINQTDMTQVTLFITEYAMTRLLMTYGIQPDAMIGHSLGEYVAACIAGVITLEDALSLVAARGRLMQSMQPGAMVSVAASEERLRDLMNEELSISVIFGSTLCVVGGSLPAVQAFTETLTREGLEYRQLHTSHAFHSPMMEPMLQPFQQTVQRVERRPPAIPYISCTTGTWITAENIMDDGYWARHVRQTVRIADGMQELLKQPERVFIEVGPSQMLKALLRQISQETARILVTVTAMRHPLDTQSDRMVMLMALGKLWLTGVAVHFAALHQEQVRRVQLPTYPFERQRYWVEAGRPSVTTATSAVLNGFEEEALKGEEPQLRATLLNAYVAPESETERRVTAIWQEFLGGSEIGINDNFFELGGDSLLAIGLIARLRETFQLELSERLLYENQTIAALSAQIDQTTQRLDRISIVPRNQPLLASWFQERAWVRDHLHPAEANKSNLATGWQLNGKLDQQHFVQCWNTIVARHEMLRTIFVEKEGQVYQVIVPSLQVSIPLIDLTTLPEKQRMPALLTHAAAQEKMPFDLQQAPLWRMCLYEIAPERYGWILIVHQSVLDGASITLIQQELSLLLSSQARGEEPVLSPLAVQFADVVAWERRHWQKGTFEPHIAYWRERFAHRLQPLELPTSRTRISEYAPGETWAWHLSPALTDQIKALAQEQGATFFMVMLAAFQMFASCLSGQEDILIETSLVNRNRAELQAFIAPLANLVTLVTNFAGDPSLRDGIERTKATVLGALAYRDLPFAKVLEICLPDYYRSYERLGRVFMVQYPVDQDVHLLPDLVLGERLSFRKATFDIYISVVDYGATAGISWEYDTHLFDSATIARMANGYTQFLETLVATPGRHLSELVFSEHIKVLS